MASQEHPSAYVPRLTEPKISPPWGVRMDENTQPQAVKISANLSNVKFKDMKESYQSMSFTAIVLTEVVGCTVKYVAQFVEHDICVQASSLKELKERVFKTLSGHIAISAAIGSRPFSGIDPVVDSSDQNNDQWGLTEEVALGSHKLKLQFA
jgi:hypothetical protein